MASDGALAKRIGLGIAGTLFGGAVFLAGRRLYGDLVIRRRMRSLLPVRSEERFDPKLVEDLAEPVRRYFLHALAPGALLDPAADTTVYFHTPRQFVRHMWDPVLIKQLQGLDVQLFVGADDVFLENNRDMAQVLTEKGVACRLHLWPGEAHRARYWISMLAGRLAAEVVPSIDTRASA